MVKKQMLTANSDNNLNDPLKLEKQKMAEESFNPKL